MLGKPSTAYFAAALEALDAEPGLTWMVGDDLEGDMHRRRRSTACEPSSCAPGSSGPTTSSAPAMQPDGIISSIAQLPDWLERNL